RGDLRPRPPVENVSGRRPLFPAPLIVYCFHIVITRKAPTVMSSARPRREAASRTAEGTSEKGANEAERTARSIPERPGGPQAPSEASRRTSRGARWAWKTHGSISPVPSLDFEACSARSLAGESKGTRKTRE